MAEQLLWNIGIYLIFLGFSVALFAVLWLVLSGMKGSGSKVRGGGVVIIGPIPIILGTDKESVKIILLLSIILVALLLILTVFWSSISR